MKARSLGFLMLAASLGLPVPGAAQDAALDGVERLVSEAKYDDARQLLGIWWDEGRSDAGRADRERGLWLRGLLTVDPAMAERDFLGIVVEFRGGTYSDDALFRLAHFEEAEQEYAGAIRHLENLLREYANSSHAQEARAMIERLEAMPPPAPPAVTGPDSSRTADRSGGATNEAPIGPAIPTATAGEPTPPTTDRPSDESDSPSDPVPDGPPVYSVQLGVFSTESRAYTLAATAEALGVPVRLARLPGTEMVHVRSGYFETLAEAEAFAREVQLTGLSGVVFDDGPLEQSVSPGVPD